MSAVVVLRGAILRYLIAGGVHSITRFESFPIGTMTVNVIGCLLIGFGGGLMESRQLFSAELRAFLFVGILGSFTTFSTFGLETFEPCQGGAMVARHGKCGGQFGSWLRGRLGRPHAIPSTVTETSGLV